MSRNLRDGSANIRMRRWTVDIDGRALLFSVRQQVMLRTIAHQKVNLTLSRLGEEPWSGILSSLDLFLIEARA
jgi:hypothetical protein